METISASNDARDLLEAQACLDGLAANNSPIGILASTGGLSTSQRIQTATAATVAIGDNYALKSGAAPRFIPNATIVGSPAFFDATYRQAAVARPSLRSCPTGAANGSASRRPSGRT